MGVHCMLPHPAIALHQHVPSPVHIHTVGSSSVPAWAITESVLTLPCRHLDLTRCTGLSDQAWFALANYRHSHGKHVSAEAYSAIAQLDIADEAGAEHSGSVDVGRTLPDL